MLCLGLAACGDGSVSTTTGDESTSSGGELPTGTVPSTGEVPTSSGTDSESGSTGPDGQDGPALDEINPNVHRTGDLDSGKQVFRFETFGNERFWTDALRLPEGVLADKFTPIDALEAGMHVDIDALSDEVKAALAEELKTDLSKQNAPMLNDVNTTVMLISANAVIGVVAVDSDDDGIIDVGKGDKVGLSCALCHGITDKSVFELDNGGSIGKRVDGPASHALDVGGAIALGANSRAYYPSLQLALMVNKGATIGRAPKGLTEESSEEDVDAYLRNKDFYPIGMFDDAPDGNGAPMHNTPLFRTDLAAPWGSEGALQFLDNFSNLVYTVLLDPTILVTPGGRAFLHKVGGAAGDEIADDYEKVLADTNVLGPFPLVDSTEMMAGEKAPAGRRVDDQKLIDMNAYLDSLAAPAGADVDEAAAARGRDRFRLSCTACHNVDQDRFVPSMIIPMKDIFPGYTPEVLAERDPPFEPIQNSPGIFDDKMVVIDASMRGLYRGIALPLLLDLARKPVFLHDNSVPTLDALFDASRGPDAPHPFYLEGEERSDMIAFLRGLDTQP